MKRETYIKAKLTVTEFDHDGIYTDVVASSGPGSSTNMLPVVTLGNPVSGVGGTDLSGQRDPLVP